MVPTTTHLEAETGWEGGEGLQDDSIVTSNEGEQDGPWDSEGKSSGARIPLHPEIP